MKPTQEQVIAWAREAGWTGIYSQWISPTEREHLTVPVTQEQIEAAFALAYDAGRESMKWDGIHSCHPDCQRPACVHTRKTYQEGYEAGRKDENEACANVCDRFQERDVGMQPAECAGAIRARREQ